MKKFFIPLLIFLFIISAANAQSNSTDVTYNKMSKPGLVLLLPYNEEVSEGTILQKLKEIGYNPETKGKLFWKQNKQNGFYVFNDVVLDSAYGKPLDLYFKIEPKSRKEKNQSYIYMMVAKGPENFISSVSEPAAFSAANNFLNKFESHSAVYKHGLDVQAQEHVIKTAEKKYSKLQDDEKDMIKKIEKLQKDLQSNKEEQEKTLKNIEVEKLKLEELKSKGV